MPSEVAAAAAAMTSRHAPLPTDVVWHHAGPTSASSAVNQLPQQPLISLPNQL